VGDLSGVRIVVVEDDESTRLLLTLFLRVSGAEVKACDSATEALLEIRQSKPDVIVSDIRMPERDGYWLVTTLRQLEPGQGRRIPAIAVTGQTTEHERARALAAGFQRHFPKPALSKDLIIAIKCLAEERRKQTGR
jgi:CheY-like chemotaxis protein